VNIVVDVSDARVSRDREDVLVTYALGSCIGLTIYDPVAGCGGLLHYQLPSSTLDAAKAQRTPHMFADSGMETLLGQFTAAGGQERRARVHIAGAAEMFHDTGPFSIGKRNHTAIRKILWQRGLLRAGEDIGGKAPRNLYLRIADGAVVVKAAGAARAAGGVL